MAKCIICLLSQTYSDKDLEEIQDIHRRDAKQSRVAQTVLEKRTITDGSLACENQIQDKVLKRHLREVESHGPEVDKRCNSQVPRKV